MTSAAQHLEQDMNPIEKALAKADRITAANADLERISREDRRVPVWEQRLADGVEDRVALVFTIDVTGFTADQRGAVEAAVSAQLDDGTEDYPAPHSYATVVLDHDTERPILDALQVGLGY